MPAGDVGREGERGVAGVRAAKVDAVVSAQESLKMVDLETESEMELRVEWTYIRMAMVATSWGYKDKTKFTPNIYHMTPFTESCSEDELWNVITVNYAPARSPRSKNRVDFRKFAQSP